MDKDTKFELTLKEYYDVLTYACDQLEEDPENEAATESFVDAAYHLAKANCGYLFPDELTASDKILAGAAKTPEEGVKITSVLEDDNYAVQ